MKILSTFTCNNTLGIVHTRHGVKGKCSRLLGRIEPVESSMINAHVFVGRSLFVQFNTGVWYVYQNISIIEKLAVFNFAKSTGKAFHTIIKARHKGVKI